MNNKYSVIEKKDGISTINITDENGKETTRAIDSNRIFYTLVSENKLEMIGAKKEEINNQITAATNRLAMLKYSIPIYPIVIATVGGFLILVKIFRPDALVGDSWQGLVASVAAGEVSVGSVAIVEHVYSKKEIKTLKEQLKALEKFEKEPLSVVDNNNYLQYSFDEANFILENDIKNVVSSVTRKKEKKIKE